MLPIVIVDILIVLIFLFYAYRGYQHGFWVMCGRLVVLVLSVIGSVLLYQPFGKLIIYKFNTFPTLAYGIGFIAALLITQIIGSILIRVILSFIPEFIQEHTVSKIFGIIPGLIDGMVTVMILSFIFLIAPVPPVLKNSVTESRLGSKAIQVLSQVESYVNERYGGILNQALTTLTTRPESHESVSLPFKPKTLALNESAEEKMLELLNGERVKAGVKPLIIDPAIIPVARAHSQDMWERQYFAHVSPDGGTLVDRFKKGNIVYLLAGENLALAQTVDLAHRGLMNSPGHRKNILEPSFGRVGIGVIDGGIYGKMFTQNFAN